MRRMRRIAIETSTAEMTRYNTVNAIHGETIGVGTGPKMLSEYVNTPERGWLSNSHSVAPAVAIGFVLISAPTKYVRIAPNVPLFCAAVTIDPPRIAAINSMISGKPSVMRIAKPEVTTLADSVRCMMAEQ